MFRLGDLARWLPDGALEFQGRRDHQIKLRVFESSSEKLNHYWGRTRRPCALVVVRHDFPEGPRLVAYVVLSDPCGDDGPRSAPRTAIAEL